MTDTVDALYDSLGDLTRTLTAFKSSATRLNEELAHLNPQSSEYRAKQLERDVAQRNWEHTAQACEAQRRLIERLEREPKTPTPTSERVLSNAELDMLLGIGENGMPGREVVPERDDLDRDR